MIDLIKTSIRDQYGAALMMVRNSIERCEPSNWGEPVGRFPFWHVAYHHFRRSSPIASAISSAMCFTFVRTPCR
jgi:hypothetical protein